LNRFVIAEIGINHDGEMDKAQRLIQMSKDAGCQAIKFQYRNIKTAYAENANEIGDEIILTQIKRTYLEASQILELRDFSRSIGVQAGISFFTTEDLDDFPNLNSDFDFYKIPSAELLNIELIETLIQTNKHVYISVGMHDEAEIEYVFSRIQEHSNWTPLHCVSNYPVADHNASLGYIKFLREKWNREVGYSSHDENWENNLIALSLGATVIERHITEVKSAEGLDHSSSSNFEEFKMICHYAREFDLISLGDAPRLPNQGELLNKQNLGRSFYALKAIQPGEKFTQSDFEYRNPQTGLNMSNVIKYVGKELVSSVSKGEVLTHLHFEKDRTTVKDSSIQVCNELQISIPIRLADYFDIRKKLPIGAYEFHLSYKEVASDLETYEVNKSDRFSVHLPDYIDSTTLIDPFAENDLVRIKSRDCIAKVVRFAERLARDTGQAVPIVSSLAGIGIARGDFYPKVKLLFDEFKSEAAPLTLQWLPPYAWYFGGSIKLENVNNIQDVNWINKFGIPLTLDSSHLLLGEAAFGYKAKEIIQALRENIVHWHISDAQGLDGEGLPLGSGGPQNEALIASLLEEVGLKVIEVWQGHFYDYEGFKVAVNKIAEIRGKFK
jgi:sialic acid synthase SpsE/sugar phosphate isomerase/epimerase